MSRLFRSYATKAVKAGPRWTEADIVTLARQLIAEHQARRIEATKAANRVCGTCEGTGKTASTLMSGELVPCHHCEGSGQPNEHSIAVPELTHEDNERMWKISQLLKGPHRVAVLQVVKEAYPDLYPTEPEPIHVEATR